MFTDSAHCTRPLTASQLPAVRWKHICLVFLPLLCALKNFSICASPGQWLMLVALDQLSLRCGPAANVTRVTLACFSVASVMLWIFLNQVLATFPAFAGSQSTQCTRLQAQMPEDMMAASILTALSLLATFEIWMHWSIISNTVIINI